MERGEAAGKQVVVAWAANYRPTHKDMGHLESNHEEADTKIILHAVDTTDDHVTELSIHSPDTDVLVLAIRRYPEMCPNTSFVTCPGTSCHTIKLKPVVETLGPAKTAVLPEFHALTGADNTGSFAGKGKPTCWEDVSESSLRALSNLGIQEKPYEETMKGTKEFICQLYQPKTAINTVEELRWSLFKKRQAEFDKLPPTKVTLHQAILRAHYQLLVWNNDCVANPVLPSPRGYGWTMEDDEWIPVMNTLLLARGWSRNMGY